MRRLLIALTLLGLTAAPALADVTARYKARDRPDTVTVSVADNGDARLDSGEGAVLIARGGERFFVARDRQGLLVGRVEDGITVMAEFLAVMMQMMEEMARQAAASAEPGAASPQGGLSQIRAMAQAAYTVEERGTESVGGRTGRLYLIAPAQAGQGSPLEVVISSDADLASVGREFRALAALVARPAGALLGAPPEILTRLDQVLALGTPIRIGEQFRLDSVSAEPIPEGSFDLPGPILTLEQLRARSPLNALAAADPEAAEPDEDSDPDPDADPDDE